VEARAGDVMAGGGVQSDQTDKTLLLRRNQLMTKQMKKELKIILLN
jgi:hypothetical protein